MSTAGLEVYDESGNLLAGVTSRLAKVTGNVTTTAGVAGSVTIPGTGRPFFLAKDISTDSLFQNTSSPSIVRQGMLITWTAAQRRFAITFGVS